MNLPKAKKIQQLLHEQGKSALHPESLDALNLGIEAFDAILEWRIDWNDEALLKLPSETEA